MAQVTPNIVMNAQMLQAAHDAGVEKFIWLGSTTAYPPSGSRPVREEELLSGDPYPAYFFVGWEKRCMEILSRMYGERLGRPVVIVLRATNIYGPNDDFDPQTSRVVAALIKKVVERQCPIEVWGRGDEVRDHIYVEDVVDAMLIACEKLDSYQAINIGSGVGYSVKELLRVILEADNYTDPAVTFDSSKPTMIPVRLIDISRARSILGFEPKTDLRTGIFRTIEWYKARRFKSESKLRVTADCSG
jgi:GDP-L-fucose synthase